MNREKGKQMKKLLVGLGLLLGSQFVLADGPCPDGQFDPNNTVCMCSGGGWVYPNQYCKKGGGGRETVYKLEPQWGAIAIDMSAQQQGGGFSRSKKSQADANQKALNTCKLGTCRVVLTFKNSCGAVAGGGNGIWGGGVDVNEYRALEKAAAACYAKGAKVCREWVKPMCAGAPRI